MLSRATKHTVLTVVLALAGAPLAGCLSGPDSSSTSAAVKCQDVEDETGYLRPICEYVATNYPDYPIDPTELEIEVIQPADESPNYPEEYRDPALDAVYLNCCYLGDVAIMEPGTREVRFFALGDI